jgi:hypothetical protein
VEDIEVVVEDIEDAEMEAYEYFYVVNALD